MKIHSRIPLLGALALVAVLSCDDDDPTGPEPEFDFTATMTGAKEKPNAISPAGSGSATVTIDEDETTISWSLTVTNMTSNVTLAHIHLGHENFAGGVIVALFPPLVQNGQTASGTINSTATLGLGLTWESLLTLIRNGNTYVNVHTANNGGGEIRGQLEPAS